MGFSQRNVGRERSGDSPVRSELQRSSGDESEEEDRVRETYAQGQAENPIDQCLSPARGLSKQTMVRDPRAARRSGAYPGLFYFTLSA